MYLEPRAGRVAHLIGEAMAGALPGFWNSTPAGSIAIRQFLSRHSNYFAEIGANSNL